MNKRIQYINPAGLLNNPSFLQTVVTEGTGKTIYTGGQNSVNAKCEIIGRDDMRNTLNTNNAALKNR
jgi:hypothetical protein